MVWVVLQGTRSAGVIGFLRLLQGTSLRPKTLDPKSVNPKTLTP